MRDRDRHLWLLALAFGLVTAPFLGQALVIDDGNFVDQALHILRNPGAPYSFPIHFNAPLDFFYYFANPPGLAYFFAGVIAAFGSSEVALHGAAAAFTAAGVAAMFAASQRLARAGLFGSLLLLATPAFLVSSHTLMADVPAAALMLAAMHLFLRGVDEDRVAWLAGAGMAAGAAGLLKYSALAVLPLMGLYLLARWRSLGSSRALRSAALSLGIASVFVGGWCLASQIVYGEVHLLAAGSLESRPVSFAGRVQQSLAALVDLGGATVFAPTLLAWSLLACFWIGRATGIAATITSLAVASLAMLPASMTVFESLPSSIANGCLLVLLLAAGTSAFCFALACTAGALRVVLRRQEPLTERSLRNAAVTLVLGSWVLGFALLDAGLLFATPKYLVPAVAPLVLLLLRSGPGMALAKSTPAASMVLAATAACGLLLSTANAEYAGTLRRFVTETVPEIAAGRTPWFTGHHAVRYYAEHAGHRPLPEKLGPQQGPAVGDVVYVIRGASKHAVPEKLRPRLEEIARVDALPKLPILMNNLRLGAGYWAHGGVPLPFAFSSASHSSLQVFRVRR